MTFDTQNLQADDKVAVVREGSVYRGVVERTTKTLVVLTNGSRFNRRTGAGVGSDMWTYSRLESMDSDFIKKMFREQFLTRLNRNLADAAKNYANRPCKATFDRLDQALNDVRQHNEY